MHSLSYKVTTKRKLQQSNDETHLWNQNTEITATNDEKVFKWGESVSESCGLVSAERNKQEQLKRSEAATQLTQSSSPVGVGHVSFIMWCWWLIWWQTSSSHSPGLRRTSCSSDLLTGGLHVTCYMFHEWKQREPLRTCTLGTLSTLYLSSVTSRFETTDLHSDESIWFLSGYVHMRQHRDLKQTQKRQIPFCLFWTHLIWADPLCDPTV